MNDEIPLFIEQEQGTVLEEMPIGTKVTQIRAIDKDGTYPNNKVRCVYFLMLIFRKTYQLIRIHCSMLFKVSILSKTHSFL